LKAIDIINFINEDKFAKYTIKQIYDELGEDEFSDYIIDVSTKIIKTNKLMTADMEVSWFPGGDSEEDWGLSFVDYKPYYADAIYIMTDSKKYVTISVHVSSLKGARKQVAFKFPRKDTGFIDALKGILLKLFSDSKLVTYRQKCIGSRN
jgi:hypothetical protein